MEGEGSILCITPCRYLFELAVFWWCGTGDAAAVTVLVQMTGKYPKQQSNVSSTLPVSDFYFFILAYRSSLQCFSTYFFCLTG